MLLDIYGCYWKHVTQSNHKHIGKIWKIIPCYPRKLCQFSILLIFNVLSTSKTLNRNLNKSWILLYKKQEGTIQEYATWHLWLSGNVLTTKSVLWHEFLFFHDKFSFGEYVHEHSVVLKVWSVKCSQITKFTLKIHTLEPQINPCYGSNKKTHANGI